MILESADLNELNVAIKIKPGVLQDKSYDLFAIGTSSRGGNSKTLEIGKGFGVFVSLLVHNDAPIANAGDARDNLDWHTHGTKFHRLREGAIEHVDVPGNQRRRGFASTIHEGVRDVETFRSVQAFLRRDEQRKLMNRKGRMGHTNDRQLIGRSAKA